MKTKNGTSFQFVNKNVFSKQYFFDSVNMTNYLQAKYEALVLNDIPLPSVVKVNHTVANHPEEFTVKEMEDVTTVFKSLETGLRQGTIFPKDLHRAITRLGLNPTDQEIVDISNYIAKDGLIYFPDFCHFVLSKLREDQPLKEAEFLKKCLRFFVELSLCQPTGGHENIN